jgi:hypothetical protein
MSEPNEQPTSESKGGGVLGFLRETWLWWLTPLVIVALAVALMLIYSEKDATSPFIYGDF